MSSTSTKSYVFISPAFSLRWWIARDMKSLFKYSLLSIDQSASTGRQYSEQHHCTIGLCYFRYQWHSSRMDSSGSTTRRFECPALPKGWVREEVYRCTTTTLSTLQSPSQPPTWTNMLQLADHSLNSVTLSICHSVNMSLCNSVTLPLSHAATLPLCYTAPAN